MNKAWLATVSMIAVIEAASAQGKIAASELMPSSEITVLRTIGAYAEKYRAADNELKKSALWKERTATLNSLKFPEPKTIEDARRRKLGWVGVIEGMGTTTEGNAWVTIRIHNDIVLATSNNEFSDALAKHRSLIKSGSAVYKQLAELKKGMWVTFNGGVGYTGNNLTEEGKMTKPSFELFLKDVKPLILPDGSRPPLGNS